MSIAGTSGALAGCVACGILIGYAIHFRKVNAAVRKEFEHVCSLIGQNADCGLKKLIETFEIEKPKEAEALKALFLATA